MLVDEGKLSWDDKVVDHIPGFAFADPWVTRNFTVADLLTHRSGLVSGAGDLMLWPTPNNFTREDIIHALRHFEMRSGFRTNYAYDNLLYIVAGELIPAVTGNSWEDFVDSRILGRLGARRCFAGDIPEDEMTNLAAPHYLADGELEVVDRNRIMSQVSVDAAAGGVRCSLGDMLTWMQLQLARGQLPDGDVLFSAAQSHTMWSAQTILRPTDADYARDKMHFRAYGLAWRLADVHGYKQVSHTGSFTGNRASVVLIPELNLGVVVLITASASQARTAIAHGIVKPFLGVKGIDWVEYVQQENAVAASAGADKEEREVDHRNGSVIATFAEYAGTYADPWFGDVLIEARGDELWITSAKSPRMTGRLWPHDAHTFIVRWTDRSLETDAYVTFQIADADASLRIVPLSTESDFDFSDLELRRSARD
jgi:CubicO group peptidase (beta-lactamase class C family)